MVKMMEGDDLPKFVKLIELHRLYLDGESNLRRHCYGDA